ncbi:hypothetical protein ACIQ34_08205 [Ureibacillus sp. NPDC094379]
MGNNFVFLGGFKIVTNKVIKVNFLFLMITSLLFGCSNNEGGLEKVKGVDVTYSEFFKTFDGLDERSNITYYKPLPIEKIDSTFPEQVGKDVKILDSKLLPIEIDEEKAFLVTFEDEEGEMKNQVQLSYLSKSEYDRVDNFFIISITEVDENPLEGYNLSDQYDTVGNKLKKEMLTEDLPIFQQVITSNSALLYRYYEYDEAKDQVGVVGTTANEIYSYNNGYVYHIGYLIDRKINTDKVQEEMLKITRDYILSN